MLPLPVVYERCGHVYHFLGAQDRKTYVLAAPREVPVVSRAAPANEYDWADMVYRYNSEEDVFRIFFIKTVDEMKKDTVPVVQDVSAVLDDAGKILLLEIRNAQKRLGCHLLDYPSEINGWPPCTLLWLYDGETDTLDIYLMSQDLVQKRFKENARTFKPFEHSILFDLDADKRLLSIEVLGASTLLCKKRKNQ